MKKYLLLFVVVCATSLVGCQKEVLAADPIKPAWGNSSPVGAPVVEDNAVSTETEKKSFALRRGLTRRDRREIGATLRNVFQIVRSIRAEDPEGFQDFTTEELSAVVTQRLIDEAPSQFFEGERDWGAFFDAVIKFIEAIIPIILKLISLFG